MSKAPLPPGKSGLPWIGETISFLKDPDFANKRRQQYGAIFRTNLFALPLKWGNTTYGKAIVARDKILAHIEGVVLERQNHPTQDALGLLVQSQDEEGNRLTVAQSKSHPRSDSHTPSPRWLES